MGDRWEIDQKKGLATYVTLTKHLPGIVLENAQPGK